MFCLQREVNQTVFPRRQNEPCKQLYMSPFSDCFEFTTLEPTFCVKIFLWANHCKGQFTLTDLKRKVHNTWQIYCKRTLRTRRYVVTLFPENWAWKSKSSYGNVMQQMPSYMQMHVRWRAWNNTWSSKTEKLKCNNLKFTQQLLAMAGSVQDPEIARCACKLTQVTL